MDLRFFINPEFKSNGTVCCKVSVCVGDMDVCFGVIRNNGKNRCQVIYIKGPSHFKSVVQYDSKYCGMYGNHTIHSTIKEKFKEYSEEQKKEVYECTQGLMDAFSNARKKNCCIKTVNDKDYDDIFHFIKKMTLEINNLYYKYQNKSVSNDCWAPFDSNSVNIEYVQRLIKTYHDAGAIKDKPFMFDGKKYRFNKDTNTMEVCSNIEPVCLVEVVGEEDNDIRRTARMFKIKDASNLQSLLEGNFYSIINEERNYIIIKDDNGNDCKVRKERGAKVEVYEDKPL